MRSRGLALLLGLAAIMAFSTATASAATPLKGIFGGDAHGTFANVKAGPIALQLGRASFLGCPCNGTGNEVLRVSVASLNVAQVLRAGAVVSTVQAGYSADRLTADMQHTSTISGLSALNGVITADVIKAVANTHADSTAITSNSNGSTFVNLRIGGLAIGANVAPNTRINLAGLGYVVLRETSRIGNGSSQGGIAVNMIRIVVTTANALGLGVGAEIIVAHARTIFARGTAAVAVAGAAWALDANLSVPLIANTVGIIAPIYLGCGGTNGNVLSNNAALVSVPLIVSSGTAVSTAFGTVSSTEGVARTTAKIEQLRLLAGLVTVDAVTAVSQSSWKVGTGGSTSGSSALFTNLRILGLLRPVSVAPNTRINLPLLGYIVLNEQVRNVNSASASLTVTAIHIVITSPLNLLGLPVGANIRIAVATTKALAL